MSRATILGLAASGAATVTLAAALVRTDGIGPAHPASKVLVDGIELRAVVWGGSDGPLTLRAVVPTGSRVSGESRRA